MKVRHNKISKIIHLAVIECYSQAYQNPELLLKAKTFDSG